MVQTALRESLLDLKAVPLIMCHWLFQYYSNPKWHMNPAFNKLVYQIISDAEILVDCQIFVDHVHFLLHLSKSQLLLEKTKRVYGDFSHRFQWKTV